MKNLRCVITGFRFFTLVCIALCASIFFSYGCGTGLIRFENQEASGPVTSPPLLLEGAPLGLMAAAANHQVALTWGAVSNAASYRIYTANSPGLTKSLTNKVAATLLAEEVTDTTYTHAGLTNGILYCYAVEAIAADGAESGLSTEVCARPMPGMGAMTIAPSTMRNTISWDPMAGDVDSWNLYWKVGSGILNPDISPDIAVTEGTTKIENAVSPYTHIGLSNNNVSYCYVLEAVVGDVTETLSEVCGTPYTIGELDYHSYEQKGFCYEWISDAMLDDEGRILVAGVDQCGGRNNKDEIIIVARFLEDGTLDRDFGEGGYFRGDRTKLPMVIDYYAPQRGERYDASQKIGVVIDVDGRIVLVSSFLDYNKDLGADDDIWYLLWRFTPEGIFDGSFGTKGVAAVSWGRTDVEIVGHDAVIDDEGRILVVGRHWTDLGIQSGIIWRILDDGTLDQTFNNKGKDQYGFFNILEPGDQQDGLDIALDVDGRMVVGGKGNINDGKADHFYGMVWRFVIDEEAMTVAPDSGFGGGTGWVQCMPWEDSYVDSIAVDAQGRILFAGAMPNADNGGIYDFVIGRLTANGVLDATFGDGGIVRHVSDGINDDYAADIVVDAAGKIVAVGMQGNRAVVHRYLENGDLDPTFGEGGIATYDGGFGFDSAVRVLIDDLGRLILGGQSFTQVAGPVDIAIWRYK